MEHFLAIVLVITLIHSISFCATGDVVVWTYPRSYLFSWASYGYNPIGQKRNQTVYANFQKHCSQSSGGPSFGINYGERYNVYGSVPDFVQSSPYVDASGSLMLQFYASQCLLSIVGPDNSRLQVKIDSLGDATCAQWPPSCTLTLSSGDVFDAQSTSARNSLYVVPPSDPTATCPVVPFQLTTPSNALTISAVSCASYPSALYNFSITVMVAPYDDDMDEMTTAIIIGVVFLVIFIGAAIYFIWYSRCAPLIRMWYWCYAACYYCCNRSRLRFRLGSAMITPLPNVVVSNENGVPTERPSSSATSSESPPPPYNPNEVYTMRREDSSVLYNTGQHVAYDSIKQRVYLATNKPYPAMISDPHRDQHP